MRVDGEGSPQATLRPVSEDGWRPTRRGVDSAILRDGSVHGGDRCPSHSLLCATEKGFLMGLTEDVSI